MENASEHGLRNLNRKCEFEQILSALRILNDFDVHVAFNLLMFEPDTVLDDILINLRFIERHIDNPFNFCRAEAYAGTGLEAKLVPEGRLLGDHFGFDYRLQDPHCEAFHQIANYAFFDRNFSDNGLHYFNMQVDFYFQLLRRFYPDTITQTMRANVRNFIKRTNLDTYERLCEIYDFVAMADPIDQVGNRSFARQMRARVDGGSSSLHAEGQRILDWLTASYEKRGEPARMVYFAPSSEEQSLMPCRIVPYQGIESLQEMNSASLTVGPVAEPDLFGVLVEPIPYPEFRRRLAEHGA